MAFFFGIKETPNIRGLLTKQFSASV